MKTRQTLIQKVKNQHDENSWKEFADLYSPYLARVLLNLNVSTSDCDDLIQKILLVCWKKLPDFEYDPDRALFRTWLSSIAKNHVMTFFRGESRKQAKSEKIQKLSVEITEPEIDRIAEKEWKSFIGNLAWESIQEEFNENALKCFVMVSEGKTADEISEEVGISAGSVYVYKKRVMEKLYKEINKLDRQYS